eukprot:COSAG02_NODE_5096_length_4629_cov_21.108955_4_plen_204_part_00
MPQRARGELSRLAKRLAAQGQVLPKWNIVTGDKVAVLAGKEKGKQGVVTKVVRRENRLFVKGLNFHKKSVKMRDQENPGGILEREAPIHYSNVQLLDPTTVTSEWPVQPGVPTRFHIGWDSTGRQVRVAKRSGLVIEKPAPESKLKSYTGTYLRCDARALLRGRFAASHKCSRAVSVRRGQQGYTFGSCESPDQGRVAVCCQR